MLNEEIDEEGQTGSLKRAMIFMIDAYSDSGIIEKDEVTNMLADIIKYYERRSKRLGS